MYSARSSVAAISLAPIGGVRVNAGADVKLPSCKQPTRQLPLDQSNFFDLGFPEQSCRHPLDASFQP